MEQERKVDQSISQMARLKVIVGCVLVLILGISYVGKSVLFWVSSRTEYGGVPSIYARTPVRTAEIWIFLNSLLAFVKVTIK